MLAGGDVSEIEVCLQMRRRFLLVGSALCCLLAACSGMSDGQSTSDGRPLSTTAAPATEAQGPRSVGGSRTAEENGCELSRKLVPTCGVLWGAYVGERGRGPFERFERAAGRPMDIYYRYYDVNDRVPGHSVRAILNQGVVLHIAIAARDFSKPRGTISWADIAAGKYDRGLRRQARSVASLGLPVFVTFGQEASQWKKMRLYGGADDFREAWRHLHRLYVREGATNAVWVWVMTGRKQNLVNAGALWPGNDVVDWISWNVYNRSGCRTGRIAESGFVSFEAQMRIFYDWVHREGRGFGIDESKPMMISEFGSVVYPGDPQKTANWYSKIPGVLAKYPQIKAVQFWNSSVGACDYRIDQDPRVRKAYGVAGRDPYVAAIDVPDALHALTSSGG